MRAEVEKGNLKKLQNFGPGLRSHDQKDVIFTMYVPFTSKMHRMKTQNMAFKKLKCLIHDVHYTTTPDDERKQKSQTKSIEQKLV